MSSHSFNDQTAFLLEALPGVAYLIDAELRIVAIGRRNWNHFAQAAGWTSRIDEIVGRPMLDFISGHQVKDLYLRVMGKISRGTLPFIEIDARCDSPSVRRSTRLFISTLPIGASLGYLIQSITIQDAARPAIDLYDFAANRESRVGSPPRPMVAICSLCQKIRDPHQSDLPSDWISPEEYYQHGGTSDVAVSHGICPPCGERWD